jgi:hypothetical protein
MPDISMCNNQECPSRLKCHRFMASPGMNQCFAVFIVPKRRKKCDSFMKHIPGNDKPLTTAYVYLYEALNWKKEKKNGGE